jgi:hypothetical protein
MLGSNDRTNDLKKKGRLDTWATVEVAGLIICGICLCALLVLAFVKQTMSNESPPALVCVWGILIANCVGAAGLLVFVVGAIGSVFGRR